MSALLAGFFLCTMGAVFAVGYLFLHARATGTPGAQLVAGALSSIGRHVARDARTEDSLRKELFRGGYRSPSAHLVFHGIQVAVAVCFALLVSWGVLVRNPNLWDGLLPAACGAGFGFLLPARCLEYQVRARAGRIRRAIPSALDLLVLATEAGQSLDQAMKDTAASLRRIYPDLSAELLFCHLEMAAGTSRAEALRRLGERSGEEELRKLTQLLIDAERFGTSLAPALRTHAQYLRARMRQRAQETARKLSVKLVLPVFFLIFPSVLLVTLGPAYLQMRAFLDSFLQ